MNEVLYLQLDERWFEMIKSGKKTKEYRKISPYWISRLMYWCDPDDFCPSRYGRISSNDALVLAREREMLFYAIMSGYIVLAQPEIVEFYYGYPKSKDSKKRFRMRVEKITLRLPRRGWVPEDANLDKLHICIDLGEMIEE